VFLGGKSLYRKRVVIMQNPLVFKDIIVSDWCATVNTPKPVNKSAWLIILYWRNNYEGVSKNIPTGRLERELQMVQLSATRCSCIAVLWVALVTSAAIALCVASQRVFIVVLSISLLTEFGYF
jgi:hypothetical protein